MDDATDRFADWDAAYVLGALSFAERRDFETHLVTCARCSAAVAELAGLPSLLALTSIERLTIDSVKAPDPLPDSMLPSLMRHSRRRARRIRRTVLAGLAVAAAIVAALLIGSALDRSPKPTSLALDQVVTSPIHARIRLVAQSWGTQVELDCRYDQPPSPSAQSDPDASAEKIYNYSLVIFDAAGRAVPGPTWSAGPGTTSELSGSTNLTVREIARVQLLGPDGQVLLQLIR